MVYVAITSFLFFLRYALRNKFQARNQIYYVVFLAIFLFVTYRYQVGCDWYGYYKLYLRYEEINWLPLAGKVDPLSHAIFDYAQDFGLPYPYAYIPFSIIFFIGIHILARRQPDPLGFLVLMFPILIINITMSAVRQGAAIGILCIAITAFLDRRPLYFSLWVVLATLFHSSAIVFLVLLPFASGRYNHTRLALATLLAVPGIILLTFSQNVQHVTNIYIASGREAYGAIFRVGVLALSSFYFFLFVKNKWRQTFPNEYSIVSIGAIGMVITLFFVPVSSIISDRYGYYFIPIQAMIFARLPYLPFKMNHLLHSALPYIGIFIVFIVWTQTSWHFKECYVPYKSWIFGLPSGNILK